MKIESTRRLRLGDLEKGVLRKDKMHLGLRFRELNDGPPGMVDGRRVEDPDGARGERRARQRGALRRSTGLDSLRIEIDQEEAADAPPRCCHFLWLAQAAAAQRAFRFHWSRWQRFRGQTGVRWPTPPGNVR